MGQPGLMTQPSWDEEIAGRRTFDSYRLQVGPGIVPWDWADMAAWERQQWIDYAKTNPEPGCRPPSLQRNFKP